MIIYRQINYWSTNKKYILLFLIGVLFFVNSNALNNILLQKKHFAIDSTKTIFYEGIKRTYHIHFPKNFKNKRALPMVLALHGGGGKGAMFEKGTGNTLTAAADKLGIVLVFPEGKNKHWNDGRSEIFKNKRAYDDVGFLSKVIDTMIMDYGIDAKRVYATGISNGGLMAIRLSIDLSEKIAAIAPVAAQLTKVLEGKALKTPISLMMFNGTLDPLMPFKGGHIKLFKFSRSRGEVLPTYATIDYFKKFNKCKEKLETTKLPDTNLKDGTQVEIEKYTNCENKTEVVLVKILGGGHTWPGGKQYLKPRIVGQVSKEINASKMILNFFLKHSKQ